MVEAAHALRSRSSSSSPAASSTTASAASSGQHVDARGVVRITLPVGGMSCAACTGHVADALKHVPGVDDASADLLTRTATVTYDATRATTSDLVAAVRASGYDADLPSARDALLERQRHDDVEMAHEARSLFVRALTLLGAMLVAMVVMSVHTTSIPHGPLNVAILVVTIALAAICAPEIFRRAWSSARRGATTMDTLIALGSITALAASTVGVVGGGGDTYFEGVLGILGFVQLGHALEARAKRSTTRALVALASLESKTARIELDDGAVRDLGVDDLRRGDTLIVRPGERVPADAIVIEGESDVDESMLTGESMPAHRAKGDKIVGGTLNGASTLRAKVTAIGEDSVLAQMVRLMREAQGRRAPIQKLADRASSVFVPAVIALAAVVLVGWYVVDRDISHAVHVAVAVLVVACPCAMGLAVPTAVMVATGRAAKRGVVVKGGDALQRAALVDTVVFDKTGTLTEGKPRVVDVVTIDNAYDANKLVAIAAALESGSEHLIGRAILDDAKARALKPMRAKDVVVKPGQGVVGVVDGKAAFVGSPRAFDHVDASDATSVVVAIDNRVAGVIRIADAVRESAKSAVAHLKARGVHVVMLTGDRASTANAVARTLGIDDVRADVLPAGKVDAVRALKSEGKHVAMIGDGINDAAALAEADVGLAIGGTDIAVEAADVSFVRADLRSVPFVLELAQSALSTMKRNLFWALAYNVVAIPIAAGALAPFGFSMSPVIASACMSLSSVSVVLSSLALGRHLAKEQA